MFALNFALDIILNQGQLKLKTGVLKFSKTIVFYVEKRT